MGGEFRYLNDSSYTYLSGHLLPDDRSFRHFIQQNQPTQSGLNFEDNTRWSGMIRNDTMITPNLNLHINASQVSDDYYLQDFSSNLSVATERLAAGRLNL